MAILYLFGGEDIKKRDCENINKIALSSIKKSRPPLVLIFAWSAPTVESTDPYRVIMRDYFTDLGAEKVIFAEISDSLKLIKEKITASNIIYLPGGNTMLLLSRLKKFKSVFKTFKGVIIGNSAGALVLCKKFINFETKDNKVVPLIVDGLGLFKTCLVVHYGTTNPKMQGRTEEIVHDISEKNSIKIFAIPECAAIVDTGKNIEFIGDVSVF